MQYSTIQCLAHQFGMDDVIHATGTDSFQGKLLRQVEYLVKLLHLYLLGSVICQKYMSELIISALQS